ncbi:hypothetical protein C5167_019268 [Papaver somniferum]|uniref:Trigger factor ribosome-binding bacterial domain-containing protein n=1 Tax=Papaver somniferum TaxID=3469 RepID=A0A4Y7ISZ6_PAPSO|nr:hypothetical protein C5167_019268 [Papaver somniferum]
MLFAYQCLEKIRFCKFLCYFLFDKMASLSISTFSPKVLLCGNGKEVSSWKARNHVYFRRSASVSIHYRKQEQSRVNQRSSLCAFALSSESEEVGISTTSLDGISVAATTTSEPLELKIRIDVTGAKTQEIFDDVFSKMVAAAQPIPGFRRVKGGKTPNVSFLPIYDISCHQESFHDIVQLHFLLKHLFQSNTIPEDILVQVLGPEKVYKNVIKRVINSSIAEYVEKEGLKITKELSVEQNYEELEAKFEPGTEFSFDAFIHLQETNKEKC